MRLIAASNLHSGAKGDGAKGRERKTGEVDTFTWRTSWVSTPMGASSTNRADGTAESRKRSGGGGGGDWVRRVGVHASVSQAKHGGVRGGKSFAGVRELQQLLGQGEEEHGEGEEIRRKCADAEGRRLRGCEAERGVGGRGRGREGGGGEGKRKRGRRRRGEEEGSSLVGGVVWTWRRWWWWKCEKVRGAVDGYGGAVRDVRPLLVKRGSVSVKATTRCFLRCRAPPHPHPAQPLQLDSDTGVAVRMVKRRCWRRSIRS